MSQVATETGSTSSLISQHIHTLDSSGLRRTESSLPFKSLGLATHQDSPTATPPHSQQQSHTGIRRSRRLVEKSTKLKKEKTVTQKRRSRSKRPHSSQPSSEPSLSSNATSDLAPSLSPINEHVTGPTSSSNRDNTSSSTGDAPELTRTTSSRPGDDQSATRNVTSLQPRNGSPIQMEHSYALTFSSTAEEIPYTNNTYPTATGYGEAPPTTTTTSSSQPISIPVSVIQTTPPIVHTTASLPHPQHQISGRGHHISSVSPMPQSILDSISRERPALPPYMLSSVEPTVTYTRNGINVYTPSVPVPTGHAQTSEWSVIARGDETLPHFNSSSPVHPRGMFEVPIPLRFGHYPMGTGIRTTLNDPTAEQNERERQRLENSTSFIASRSHERSTAGLRRGRRSNRTNETRVEVEVTEPSNDTSSSRHHGSRSRSPNQSTLSDHSDSSGHGRRRTRRRARPNNQLFNTAPLTSMSVHVNRGGSTDVASVPLPPHHLPPVPPQMQGFQIVPQASGDVVARTSSTPLPQTAVLPSVQLPQRFGVPLNSTVFQMTPQLSRNSSEPIYQLSPPQPELLRSHSGSPFHSPGSHSAIVLGNDSMSHSGGAVQFLPVTIDDEPQPASNQTQEVPMVDTREQAVPQSLRATQRDQRLPRRRQSHVEVIIVDSDSEDDDVIVSHVTRVPSSTHLPGRQPVSTDEVFARRLQDQFDQEATRASAVHAGPSIPLPRPTQGLNVDSGSLIRDNYEALVSHIERLTQNDAIRMLTLARSHAHRRTGRRPRTQAEFARAMENMGETLLVNAIFGGGSPIVPGTSYEDLLELAETLGPARPQGLAQEVINNLPLREYNSSLDATTSGEQPKCVVCMCDFEERDKLRTLPCVHEFHQPCIDQWLKDHRTCPICRVEVSS